MKVIITGGCGFVGHHLVEEFLKNTDHDIVIFDKLNYASSGLDRVRDINAFDDKRVKFFAVDFTREISFGVLKECNDADYIFHLGAESHVDNSITDPMKFVYANVVGTGYMLEFARKCHNLKAFNYFSTDEVHGPAPKGVNYKETDRYDSGNPYSATKAGAEQLALAYANTYGLPLFITRCMNIYGERQHHEKYIPLCINKLLKGEEIKIHGTPDKLHSGSRFYIHARNVANALRFLMDNFKQREVYNIVGEKEISNLKLAQMISLIMDKPLKFEIINFHESRPGHDLRYALDGSKMRSIGWYMPVKLEQSLRRTVNWTLENRKWLG